MYLLIAELVGGGKVTLRSSQNLNLGFLNVSQTLTSIQKTQVQILAGSQCLVHQISPTSSGAAEAAQEWSGSGS